MKKGKIIALLVIGIFLVCSVFIGTSYSVWMVTKSQSKENIVKSDCFNITYTEGEAIYLNNIYPISDSEGSQLTPYTFTVKNTCNRALNYNMNLEYMNTSTIDTNFVRVKVNEYQPITYKDKEGATPIISGASKAALIQSGIIQGQESKTYNLRLWIKESATSEDVGNTKFLSRVSITVTPNIALKDIELHANGGNVSYTKLTVNPGEKLENLPYPSKENYAFKGWYNNENFDTLITRETIMNEGLDNLYAKWVESNHTITLNAGDGSVEPTSINAVIGEEIGELPIPTINDETKSFLGWYSDSLFENVVTKETIVESTLTNLYAKYGIADGYYYWNDSYSSTTYTSTRVPTTVYPNYTSLVSGSGPNTFIRSTYQNGSLTGHEACLYYNSKAFCIAEGYWSANGSSGESVKNALQSAMESAIGTSATRCYSGSDDVFCRFGSANCIADSNDYVYCGDGSRRCSVNSVGSAYCY